jgi:hypothetical protein
LEYYETCAVLFFLFRSSWACRRIRTYFVKSLMRRRLFRRTREYSRIGGFASRRECEFGPKEINQDGCIWGCGGFLTQSSLLLRSGALFKNGSMKRSAVEPLNPLQKNILMKLKWGTQR